LARARRDLDAGRPLAALDRAEKVLAAGPSQAVSAGARAVLDEAVYRAARADLEEGRFEQVAALDRRAAERLPGRSPRLANLVLQAERKIPAEVALARAGSLVDYGYPLSGEVFVKDLPVRDAAAERVEADMKKALERHPGDPRLLLNYGQFLLQFNDYDKAEECFREALRMDVNSAEAHLGLGLVAYERKDYPLALDHFTQAARLAPDAAAPQLNTAICLDVLKRPGEARPYWERAEKLTPDPALRQRIREHLH
jgi:tetratricopeptide (TPR) repeat protein